MKGKVLLGIDGGGTYTRVAVTDLDGVLLSYVEWKGGAFIYKDAKAKDNVFNAVQQAVKQADCTLGDIVAFTAGIAGCDNECDLGWVRDVTNIDGLDCPRQHTSDAEIAHRGALLFQPGIISISGTGSVIFGITETGRHVRSHAFHYYSATASRCLTYNCVYKIIAGEIDHTDDDLVQRVFAYFNVNTLSELVTLGSAGFVADYGQREKFFGDFAPVITAAALHGSQVAAGICNQVAADIVMGIKIVGACFESDAIQTALIGSVSNSTFINHAVQKILSAEHHQRYVYVKPALPAVLGAITMAMRSHHIHIDERIQHNIAESAETILSQNLRDC